jgi:hypothetical protein
VQAAWETGDNWPVSGEVDVLEGVNDEGPNLSSLHTNYGCTMPPVDQRPMSGGYVLAGVVVWRSLTSS